MSHINKEVENIKNKQDIITVELSDLKVKVNDDMCKHSEKFKMLETQVYQLKEQGGGGGTLPVSPLKYFLPEVDLYFSSVCSLGSSSLFHPTISMYPSF